MALPSGIKLVSRVAIWCMLPVLVVTTDSSPAADEAVQTTETEVLGVATVHWQQQLPVLVASCVLAGIMASFAVYYDDDGDPTGLDQIPGGDRQAKIFGVWVGSGLFVLGCGGLCFQDSWGHYPP